MPFDAFEIDEYGNPIATLRKVPSELQEEKQKMAALEDRYDQLLQENTQLRVNYALNELKLLTEQTKIERQFLMNPTPINYNLWSDFNDSQVRANWDDYLFPLEKDKDLLRKLTQIPRFFKTNSKAYHSLSDFNRHLKLALIQPLVFVLELVKIAFYLILSLLFLLNLGLLGAFNSLDRNKETLTTSFNFIIRSVGAMIGTINCILSLPAALFVIPSRLLLSAFKGYAPFEANSKAQFYLAQLESGLQTDNREIIYMSCHLLHHIFMQDFKERLSFKEQGEQTNLIEEEKKHWDKLINDLSVCFDFYMPEKKLHPDMKKTLTNFCDFYKLRLKPETQENLLVSNQLD